MEELSIPKAREMEARELEARDTEARDTGIQRAIGKIGSNGGQQQAGETRRSWRISGVEEVLA